LAIKIFIDQGHNPSGVNAGAEGFGLREQDVNYNVGIYLANLLNADPRFEARTSRTTPEESLGYNNTSSLTERVRLANSWPANYFISIHCNSNPNPAINGTEVYVYQTLTQAYYLAEHVLQAIVSRVGTRNNGVRVNSRLYVLRRTTMPSILVELGYLSNASDAEKLRNDQYQFAYAIYEGLLNYFGFEPIAK
jgi:N-acetylmuramoyl-L-alanine amidase